MVLPNGLTVRRPLQNGFVLALRQVRAINTHPLYRALAEHPVQELYTQDYYSIDWPA